MLTLVMFIKSQYFVKNNSLISGILSWCNNGIISSTVGCASLTSILEMGELNFENVVSIFFRPSH